MNLCNFFLLGNSSYNFIIIRDWKPLLSTALSVYLWSFSHSACAEIFISLILNVPGTRTSRLPLCHNCSVKNPSINLLACFDCHMRKWEDNCCSTESWWVSKFTAENQKPWVVNTLRKWQSTERPGRQILLHPHTLSPEGHLLLVSRAAQGQGCSGFHEDNAGAVQLREEIN